MGHSESSFSASEIHEQRNSIVGYSIWLCAIDVKAACLLSAHHFDWSANLPVLLWCCDCGVCCLYQQLRMYLNRFIMWAISLALCLKKQIINHIMCCEAVGLNFGNLRPLLPFKKSTKTTPMWSQSNLVTTHEQDIFSLQMLILTVNIICPTNKIGFSQ